MQTDDFLNLDTKQVIEWVSSDDITISAEEDVFKGIVKWVSHNKSQREKNFPDLLHQVRLNSVSHDFLLNELVKEELITTNNECLNFVLGSFKWIFNPTNECAVKPARKSLQTHTDVIFVCGGKRAACYLPQQNIWYQLADGIFEEYDNDVVLCKDKVYTVSYREIESGKKEAGYYMCSTNSWTAFQTKCEERADFSSNLLVLNDVLYGTGGSSGMLFIYHPDKNEWSKVEDPYCRRCGTCGVSNGRHFYLIGGTQKSGISDSTFFGSTIVERFDPSRGSWEVVAAMNEERGEAFGAAMNGKIYVAGGYQSNYMTILNTCEVYNPSTDEWQLMPSLNVPRYLASMVCLEGALYVVAGTSDNVQGSARELSVEMFNFETNEWKKESAIPVYSLESEEGRENKYYYRACFATIPRKVLSELEPLT